MATVYKTGVSEEKFREVVESLHATLDKADAISHVQVEKEFVEVPSPTPFVKTEPSGWVVVEVRLHQPLGDRSEDKFA